MDYMDSTTSVPCEKIARHYQPENPGMKQRPDWIRSARRDPAARSAPRKKSTQTKVSTRITGRHSGSEAAAVKRPRPRAPSRVAPPTVGGPPRPPELSDPAGRQP